jgi:hypothetical protein
MPRVHLGDQPGIAKSSCGNPLFWAYIGSIVLRSFGRGRPINAPAAFIHPCQPIVAKQAPTGPHWAHELKHDGCLHTK